jgi:hypothetical protein
VCAADAVQRRRRCDGAGALPAGAAAGVVLVKEPVVARNDASIQRRGSWVWVVGDARQFTGVAGDKIAM